MPAPNVQPDSGLDTNNFINHPTYTNALAYSSKTKATDYSGEERIRSAYIGALLEFENQYRLHFGTRVERYKINVEPKPDSERTTIGPYVEQWQIDKILEGVESSKVSNAENELYPSITLAKDFEVGIKTSISYGETTARPNFRELAYVETYDPIRERLFSGNPSLVPSKIKNYDLRVDWNLSERDILSISLFKKEIKDPIQAIYLSTNSLEIPYNDSILSYRSGTDLFVNSQQGEVYGVELEGKIGLEEISELLHGFRLGGNLTWSQSSVNISNLEKSLYPNESSIDYNKFNVANRYERPLEGQSEWIYTIDLSYNNEDLGLISTLVYSFYDERLFAGAFGYPDDLWEDSFSTLDFISTYNFGKNMEWSVKFSAKNLTAENRQIKVRNHNAIDEQYPTSRIFSVSLEKSF